MIHTIRLYIEKYRLLSEDRPVLVGLSGGADSVALLGVLVRLGYPCIALHCNFHLRGEESDRDEAFACEFAESLEVPFHKIDFDTISYAGEKHLSIEMAARELRYAWFEEMRERLKPIARELGLTELLKKYPYEVSGGQKQRAAVARAIITQPKLLLADEPTGALDSRAADELMRLFESVNAEGQTIVMVTHSLRAASRARRVLFIKDGEVFHQLYRASLSTEEFYQRISDALTLITTGGAQNA